MPYSVSKAAQLHLMRCLAATQGPKVRVNAVLPGLLKTEWVSADIFRLLSSLEIYTNVAEQGVRYSAEAMKEMEEKAWLKKDVSLWFLECPVE